MPLSFLRALEQTALIIENVLQRLGAVLCWLLLAMTLLVAGIIVARFGFDLGSTAAQELVNYLHAISFMLAIAYCAQCGGHVRVDIFYRRYSALAKAWLNLVGALIFLLPFATFLMLISIEPAMRSWAMQEASINPGGLPFLYLLKMLPSLAGFLLALHAFATICRELVAISVLKNEPQA